jgi:3-keto-disaccharide hydrolase
MDEAVSLPLSPPVHCSCRATAPSRDRFGALARPFAKGTDMKGILAAAMLLFLMEVTAMADNRSSFETDAVGATPKGWTATSTGKGDPKWTVEQDATAPSKSKVLKQSGRAPYPVLLKDDTNIKDGFIEAKFKAVAGSEDRAGGLVWRARDADNYYVVRANALEDNVVLYKTVGGVRSALDIVGRKGGYGVAAAVPANRWLALRVEFKGSRFRVLYNGKQLFEVEDSTFGGAGKVGLWTKADSVTLFDEIIYGETK